jgi:hypothetical protein
MIRINFRMLFYTLWTKVIITFCICTKISYWLFFMKMTWNITSKISLHVLNIKRIFHSFFNIQFFI